MNATRIAEVAAPRRTLFTGLSILLTVSGVLLLLGGYVGQPLFWGDYVLIALFPLLFGQLSAGFVLAVFGFYDELRRGDPHHLMRAGWRETEESIPLAATAIVVPIFNEEVGRVAKGIANIWRSLEKTGQIGQFDIYLLSDSNQANRWVEEECAWIALCRELNAFGKIFYRKRRGGIHGKSGNVADFCRRWGKRYRYMVVLDADSVMSGPTLVRLVRAMEANPTVGILQTRPVPVLGRSLFRRMRQFAGSLYGSAFFQGCSLVQMASASYWGHNAIIRLAPFIAHCGLPQLPLPERTHVLSHDTVEAALMYRAGYEVWVAFEEPGSYEEEPPNVSDMLKRDRRWCMGNLQHFWFLFARGIALGNRLQLAIGLMSYLCSPLWLIFLIAGSFASYSRERFLALSAGPEALGAAAASSASRWLPVLVLVLLFAPRVLSLLTALPRARLYGGFFRLAVGAILETLFSSALAPLLMIFHTLFVTSALVGFKIHWTNQNRADTGLSLGECLKTYGWVSLLGAAMLGVAFHYMGAGGFWLLPVLAGWMLAPFLAWISSQTRLGLAFKKRGLFLTPEESNPPVELEGLEDEGDGEAASEELWAEAVLSPYVMAIHLSMVRQRLSPSGQPEGPRPFHHAELCQGLIREGPGSIDRKLQMRLLASPETVSWLHRELWSQPEKKLHPDWLRLQAECGRSFLLSKYLMPQGALFRPCSP